MYSVHCTWTCWWQVSSMYLTLNSFFFRLKLKILLTYYCTICYENLIFRQLSWRLFRNKWFSLFFLTITAQWILIARRNQMVITLWDGIPRVECCWNFHCFIIIQIWYKEHLYRMLDMVHSGDHVHWTSSHKLLLLQVIFRLNHITSTEN